MTVAVLIAILPLALAAFGLTAGALLFLTKTRDAAKKTPLNLRLPKAAILLALRGPDVHLVDCLRSLLRQDYPDYDLHIVVDSEDDPAWKIVTDVIAEEGAENVRAALLRDPLFTCSLKCSALLQMIADVDPDVEIVALVDGDVVPHSTWLRQLAAPLADPCVGATFGIPWYFPTRPNVASVARKVCWAPAGILMAIFGWIWGGTAALPSRVFRDPQLVERWSRSVSSDASIPKIIRAHNLRLKWIPALVMPNFEQATFETLLSQLARSLATSRLYLNSWPLTLIVVAFAVGALILAMSIFVISISTANVTAAVASGAGLGGYVLLLTALLLLVEWRARRIIESNGAAVPRLELSVLAKIALIIPPAHGIYLVSAIKAHYVRTLTWRGVRYAVNGKLDVRRVEPVPVAVPSVRMDDVFVGERSGKEIDPLPLNLYGSGSYRLVYSAIPAEGPAARSIR